MATIRQLVENQRQLNYQALCEALMEQFGVRTAINWNGLLPTSQQQVMFGGEVLRLVADHAVLANQKDITVLHLKKGSTSQMLFLYLSLVDNKLPKAHIEQITKRFIKGEDANRYIVWFFGNQAATELKVVLSGKEGKKVVMKTLPFGVHQPYYKTYDFILTELASKVQSFFVEPTDLWKALWKAFDISIVNRKFYLEIKQAFDSLLVQIKAGGNPFETEDARVQFAIRLIGRIIFCWFLKRKGILEETVLSSAAVARQPNTNYYHDVLELLFFEVMNKPENERIKGLPASIAHYPFLNGGLFDAHTETDFYNADTSTPDFRLQIGNDWFYNFFSNTLKKYNFTVDENSSSNAEIAIDPEMLGRIFENLLAEQNPETGASARKATGAFYTPREVVEYMVEQSLIEYLTTALQTTRSGKLREEIEEFVYSQQLPDALETKLQTLQEVLDKIKVLDPACGSGAFPIGVLQKLIALKQELLQAKQPKKQLIATDIYRLKLDTLQKSIYGVDIQPMAVELSRLRCWLSLVVNEEISNIRPLPNLDFKFVCADSLIEAPKVGYETNELYTNLAQLEENVEQYFSPNFTNKGHIRGSIQTNVRAIGKFHHNLVGQVIKRVQQEEKTASQAKLKKLRDSITKYNSIDAKWESYNNLFQNKKVDFFSPAYFFHRPKTVSIW